MSEWLPKSEHFHEDQKCSEGPKMQNKPYMFFLETGVPKRGGGGGVRHLGKIPQTSRLGGVLYHCYVILIVMPIVMMVVPDHDDPLSTTTKPWIIRGKLPKREREV